MRTASDLALKNNLIKSVTRDKYFVSSKTTLTFLNICNHILFYLFLQVTEMEIFEGIFTVEDPNKSALCFIRTIENLENNLTDSTISRFIDTEVTQNKEVLVDSNAKNLLNILKNEKIPAKLNPDKNIFKFNVSDAKNLIFTSKF